MTYRDIEDSIEDGKPTSLYEIRLGTLEWFYTTAEYEVTHNANLYLPLPVRHTDVSQTSDITKSNVTVTLPRDIPLCDHLKPLPPSGVVTVTVFEKHIDDAEHRLVWKGRVINSEWEGRRCKLTVESIMTSLNRRTNKLKDSAQCSKTLYSCGVDKLIFEASVTADSVVGLTISSTGFSIYTDGWFNGGYVEWDNLTTGATESRMISSSTTTDITVTSVPFGLVATTVIRVYPGCNRRITTCKNKFNNGDNCGSTPYIPTKNPFGGTIIF